MAAFKNKDNGTWYVQFRYTDWKGERQQKLKRGFATKREALEWEREFLMEKQADVNMTFESFVALYERDIKPKLKLNTWLTKESIIKKKILPYFAKRKLSEITAKDIMRWQNEIREMRDCHGKPLSKTYLKTVHNQLSAIFNHAARFYGLNINPARQAGNMGAEERKEMLFWTREEYTKFSEAMMDKPLSFYAFEVLYWCGVREGELLALTPADFDFEKRTLTINKSYQRINKQDVITLVGNVRMGRGDGGVGRSDSDVLGVGPCVPLRHHRPAKCGEYQRHRHRGGDDARYPPHRNPLHSYYASPPPSA